MSRVLWRLRDRSAQWNGRRPCFCRLGCMSPGAAAGQPRLSGNFRSLALGPVASGCGTGSAGIWSDKRYRCDMQSNPGVGRTAICKRQGKAQAAANEHGRACIYAVNNIAASRVAINERYANIAMLQECRGVNAGSGCVKSYEYITISIAQRYRYVLYYRNDIAAIYQR